VSYGEVLVDKSSIDLILRALHYIVAISFEYILYRVCFHLYCGCFNLFCNVWVCGFVMCGCVYVWVCNVCVLVICTLDLFGYSD